MLTMILEKEIKRIMVVLTLIGSLFAGCGNCEINNQNNQDVQNSSFIDKAPFYGGKLEGFVIASCNKCNLGSKKDKTCSMGIMINGKTYLVDKHIHNHDKAHEVDGICNSLRIAYVSGKIKKNKFYADTFRLINASDVK